MSDADPEFPDSFYDKLNGGASVLMGAAYNDADMILPDMVKSHEVVEDLLRAREANKKGKKTVKQDKAEGIKLKIRMLKKELKRLESRPEEPEEDGNVITFMKQFAAGGIVYSYAALKAKGLWYTTGPKSPKGYTWDELLDFIGDDNRIYLVTEATPLIGG
jgi:hypothetical protein